MDEVGRSLLAALLDGDIAAGLALHDRLLDCGDRIRAARLAWLLGILADRVETAWHDTPDNPTDLEGVAWDQAAETVTVWDQFTQEVRRLFWVVVSSEEERKRLQWRLSMSEGLVNREYPD